MRERERESCLQEHAWRREEGDGGDIFFFSRGTKRGRTNHGLVQLLSSVAANILRGRDSVKLKKGGSTPRILPIIRVVTHDTAV